jgi:signal transduction histidine kinase
MIALELLAWKIPIEDRSKLEAEIPKIEHLGKKALNELREIMFNLKPAHLHEDGLVGTLKELFADYEAQYDMEIEFVVKNVIEIKDSELEIALHRIIQEAIINSRKHSGAAKVTVSIEEEGSDLHLIVQDLGKGFELDDIGLQNGSYGLIGMKERAALFDGTIDIISSSGWGTKVHIKVPLGKEAYHGTYKGSHSR